jgi:hypothetical protein
MGDAHVIGEDGGVARGACRQAARELLVIQRNSNDKGRRFTRLVREQLASGDVAARKAYLSSVVDAIIVSEDKIRIVGSNDNIRSTFGPKGQPTPVVRKSVQEWCPGAGSNHRHCDFQSHALPTELPGHFPRPQGLGAGVYSQAGQRCLPRSAFGFAWRSHAIANGEVCPA